MSIARLNNNDNNNNNKNDHYILIDIFIEHRSVCHGRSGNLVWFCEYCNFKRSLKDDRLISPEQKSHQLKANP